MNKITTFRERLIELLTINNITQAKLSKDTKIDKSLISRYIKGQCEAKQNNLDTIAKYFNVSYGYLLGYDVPKNNNLRNDLINLIQSMNENDLLDVKKFIDTFVLEKENKEEK